MSDLAFYARRAEQELGLALRATAPAAMKVHRELAAAYLAMLDNKQQSAIEERIHQLTGQHPVSPARTPAPEGLHI